MQGTARLQTSDVSATPPIDFHTVCRIEKSSLFAIASTFISDLSIERCPGPTIMDNPVEEIANVIHLLTQSPPSTQRQTIEKYFTANASFTHPFCRTGRWPNSRVLVGLIYRWYKIMSPSIDITVQSVGMRNLDSRASIAD